MLALAGALALAGCQAVQGQERPSAAVQEPQSECQEIALAAHQWEFQRIVRTQLRQRSPEAWDRHQMLLRQGYAAGCFPDLEATIREIERDPEAEPFDDEDVAFLYKILEGER